MPTTYARVNGAQPSALRETQRVNHGSSRKHHRCLGRKEGLAVGLRIDILRSLHPAGWPWILLPSVNPMMSDSIPPEQQAANQEAGKRLREIRQKAGMSQEDVSFAAEIDQSALSKAERLGPQVVSWQKLFAIADALGCLVEVSFRPK